MLHTLLLLTGNSLLTDASTDGLPPKARRTAPEKRLLESQALIIRNHTGDSTHDTTEKSSAAS